MLVDGAVLLEGLLKRVHIFLLGHPRSILFLRTLDQLHLDRMPTIEVARHRAVDVIIVRVAV